MSTSAATSNGCQSACMQQKKWGVNVGCMVSQKTTRPVGPNAANGMKYTHVLFYDGLHEKASRVLKCHWPHRSPLSRKKSYRARPADKRLKHSAKDRSPRGLARRSLGHRQCIQWHGTNTQRARALHTKLPQRHARFRCTKHTHKSQKPIVSTRIFRNRSVV